MRRGGLLLLLSLGACLALAEEAPRAVPVLDEDAIVPDAGEAPLRIDEPQFREEIERRERVESSSRQFGVSGGSSELRGSLALEAEAVRTGFLRILGLDDDTPVTMPIEIILHGRTGEAPRERDLVSELRFTRDTFLLNVHVDLSRGLPHDRLRHALLRGMIYQRSLQDVQPGTLEQRLRVPAWVVVGLGEARAWREGRGERALYEGVFRSGWPFSTDDLLTLGSAAYGRLDGVSREMFRALSGALVMALLEQPEGRASLASLTTEVARFEGEYPILLRRHFPSLNLSEQSLKKWWALTLAKLSDAPVTDSMTIGETERELESALMLRHEVDGFPQSTSFGSWSELGEMEEAERFAAIRPAQQALNRLSYRCFPSYRPLLLEYQNLLVSWAEKGGDEGLSALLWELSETRAIMSARALRARDYLDFMEIDGANELSGDFDDYMRLKRELREKPRVERDDPISNYLDKMDRLYERRDGRK